MLPFFKMFVKYFEKSFDLASGLAVFRLLKTEPLKAHYIRFGEPLRRLCKEKANIN